MSEQSSVNCGVGRDEFLKETHAGEMNGEARKASE